MENLIGDARIINLELASTFIQIRIETTTVGSPPENPTPSKVPIPPGTGLRFSNPGRAKAIEINDQEQEATVQLRGSASNDARISELRRTNHARSRAGVHSRRRRESASLPVLPGHRPGRRRGPRGLIDSSRRRRRVARARTARLGATGSPSSRRRGSSARSPSASRSGFYSSVDRVGPTDLAALSNSSQIWRGSIARGRTNKGGYAAPVDRWF